MFFVSQCPIRQNTFRTDHTLLQGPVGSCICCTLWLRNFTLVANLTLYLKREVPNIIHDFVLGALRLRGASACNHSINQLCQALFTVRVGQLYSRSQASPYNSQHWGELGKEASLALEHGVTNCIKICGGGLTNPKPCG